MMRFRHRASYSRRPSAASHNAVEPLHSIEVRVLAALLEKDLTTPEYYPLTLNALSTPATRNPAANRSSHYDETTVDQGWHSCGKNSWCSKVTGAGIASRSTAHRLGKPESGPPRAGTAMRADAARTADRRRAARTHGAHARVLPIWRRSSACSKRWLRVSRIRRGRSRHPRPLDASVERCRRPSEAPPEGIRMRPAGVRGALESRVAALEGEVADLKRQMESFRRQFE